MNEISFIRRENVRKLALNLFTSTVGVGWKKSIETTLWTA